MSEGLALNYTTEGKKAGVLESRTAHFVVAIAYGKGVVSCDHYFHHLKSENFADYVPLRFPQIILHSANPTAKRFLQDGNPSSENYDDLAAKVNIDLEITNRRMQKN